MIYSKGWESPELWEEEVGSPCKHLQGTDLTDGDSLEADSDRWVADEAVHKIHRVVEYLDIADNSRFALVQLLP